MDLTAAELTALDAGTQRIGIFFYLATTPAVRIWMGVGKMEPGVNAIDLTGQVYNGFGELIDVPVIRTLVNGAAERMEFALSAVSQQVLDLAANDAEEVKNKEGALGFALMDSDWQLIGPVHWVRHFVADFLSLRQAVKEELDGAVIRTVMLSVGTQTTNRRQPALSFFTNQDQQRRAGSPPDRFCERVGLYRQEVTKVWPDF